MEKRSLIEKSPDLVSIGFEGTHVVAEWGCMRRNVQKPPWLEEGAYLLRVKRSSRDGMYGSQLFKKATTDVLCIPQVLPSFASGPDQSLRFRSCLYLPSHYERRGSFSSQRTNLCISSVCIPAPLTESRPETSLREQSPTALHFVSHCHTET